MRKLSIPRVCHEECKNDWCIGPERSQCLICQDEARPFRDLNSWNCFKECPANTIPMASTDLEGNIILKYCRGKEYFVDPSSSKRYEFGTRQYPFKSLDDPFRELF